jgi:hypothetical protein
MPAVAVSSTKNGAGRATGGAGVAIRRLVVTPAAAATESAATAARAMTRDRSISRYSPV